MTALRTKLRTVRGLGAAHEGTTHFWLTRISGLALVPLTLFAVGLVFALIGKDQASVQAVIGRPLVAIPLILFVVISVEHMRLGIQETIADYIHGELLKVLTLAANTAFCIVVGAASVFSILVIAFGA
jgi:succinate dehydrogenase / fumarate reductase membrane anchor subunit